MIPRPYIAKWQRHAPWKQFAQIEQDLVISRTLIEIFSDDLLNTKVKKDARSSLCIWRKVFNLVTLDYIPRGVFSYSQRNL